MEWLFIILIGAATVGVCFLVDKGFTRIFRSKAQHKTGLSVRLSQHYGGVGLILLLLGLLAIFNGLNDGVLLLAGGFFVMALGVGLIVHYMSFGIYYDADSFILTTFGKKSTVYAYQDIVAQKLYQVTGGNIMVELYLENGKSVTLQSSMKGMYPFLDTAFSGWCRQKGITAEDCPFYDPHNSCWFPTMEV